ncbi:MAG: nucleotidyltransferase domain-containing protein [Chloroflexi bacterium]|nr:nucleotidyltransferase domain-containing protein [Chloroflexota bacterium]
MRNWVEMLPMDKIAEFCRRWKIQEMAVFGSALRADFSPESDIDVIVAFDDTAEWSLLDHIRMQQELQAILQRDVDLVTRRAIERSQNWIRRKEILSTASIIFPEDKAIFYDETRRTCRWALE